MPETSLGGDTGVWRGQSERLGLADIEAQLRSQKEDEKAPIHWVEIPGHSRVLHVTEVPELWDAQEERDLRHARAAIRKHGAVTLVTAGASIAAMALGAPAQATFVLLMFGIQSAETWFESAGTRRQMRQDRAGYFHRCSREVRYVFWVHTIRDSALWRTWSLSLTWVALFVIQLVVGLDNSIERAGLVKPSVWQGEVWRLLTGAMLHGNHWHIFMNASSSISLSLLIERTAHRHVLVPLWLLGALGGSLCSLALLPESTSVGASGGLMGFVGFLAMMGWKRKHLLPPQFAANILRSVAFMAVFGLAAWSVIDNAAHAGGALTGALVGHRVFNDDNGNLPLADTNCRTYIGWLGAAVFGALLALTLWRLLARA